MNNRILCVKMHTWQNEENFPARNSGYELNVGFFQVTNMEPLNRNHYVAFQNKPEYRWIYILVTYTFYFFFLLSSLSVRETEVVIMFTKVNALMLVTWTIIVLKASVTKVVIATAILAPAVTVATALTPIVLVVLVMVVVIVERSGRGEREEIINGWLKFEW